MAILIIVIIQSLAFNEGNEECIMVVRPLNCLKVIEFSINYSPHFWFPNALGNMFGAVDEKCYSI